MSDASRAGGGPCLSVSVAIDDQFVPRWIITLLDSLLHAPGIRLTHVLVTRDGGHVRSPPVPGLAVRVLAAVDEAVFSRKSGLYRSADVAAWCRLRGVHICERDAERGVTAAHDGATILLDFGSAGAPHVHGGATDVWTAKGVPLRSGWPGFEEPSFVAATVGGRHTLEVTLSSLKDRVKAVAVAPVHPCSPLMSASFAAVSAQQLVVAELQKARFARASDTWEGAVDAKGGQQVRMNGRKAAIPRYLMRSAQWAGRRVGWSQEWRLLIGRSGGNLGEDASSFTRVAAPRGHFWADPCVVIEDGQPHVFFEDYEHRDRKGRIAVMTIGPSGRCGPAHRVLETDVHLSYPFVFRHQGRLYMVPESADAESVDLYECVHFPCDWVFRRNLLSGVRLVDATLARWNDVWWMFASNQHPDGLRGADLLMLYFSEDPVEGEWKRHPASPLMADVTRARSAGSLFVHSGRLYRPSQDGSRGYGSAIAINEILQLDDRTYVERRTETVSPPFGAFGTHTISRAGGIAVMDACAWIPRWRAT